MDYGKLKKLNAFHVVFLAQNTMVGLYLFSLPNLLSSAGYSQWLIPLIYGVLANLTLIPIIMLCKKYPNDSLFKITEKILGKTVGKLLNLILFIHAVFGVASISSGYIRLVQTIVLPQYTLTYTSIFFTFVLICIVHGGIKSIARFCIFSFFFTGWMVYFLQWAFLGGEWIHAIPTFDVSLNDWLNAMHSGAPSMYGYALIMYYYPYIINQKKAYLHTTIGIWIAVFFYFAVSIASVIYFSPWQLENLLFPVLNLFKAVILPFVERIETLGTTLWVFLTLSTASAYLWVAKKGVDALLSKHKNRTWHLYVSALIALLLYLGPVSVHTQSILFDEWTPFYGYGFLLLPIILLVIEKLKARKGASK